MKYQIDSKHKIVDISEIEIKPYNAKNLMSLLKKIIAKYPHYSITFPMFHKKEKEYSANMHVLPKLKFKLISIRPVLIKAVKKKDDNYSLSFKTLKEVKSEKLFKKIYYKAIKKTFLITDYFDKLNPAKAFKRYVLNKEKPEWNILAYKDNKLVGFVCFGKRKYLGEFGTIKYIALDPEYQGKGYSKELLNKVENELYKAGIKEWRESTDEKNVSMIKAFLSQGLKKKRELFYYIYNPEVAFKKFI